MPLRLHDLSTEIKVEFTVESRRTPQPERPYLNQFDDFQQLDHPALIILH